MTGREERLRRWVERYQTALLRICYLNLHDRALAEDAVQETFVKAYRAMPSFRGESGEKTWLTRIAINTCRDMQRSAWLRHVDRRVTPEMLPQAAAPYTGRDEALTLAIMQLPRRCREAVVLRYYEGLTLEKTAQALGVSPSTVSTQLNRAKKKLRSLLEGGDWDE